MQPLTELNEKKCKRCGLFEMDSFKPDDVFDEWELCPGDFVDGKYVRFKDREVNATLICLECSDSNGRGIHMIGFISFSFFFVFLPFKSMYCIKPL